MFVYTHFQAPVFISVKISHVSEMITRRLSQSFTKLRRLSLMTQPTRQIDVEDEDTQVNNTHTMPSPAAMGLSEVNSLDYVSSDNDAASPTWSVALVRGHCTYQQDIKTIFATNTESTTVTTSTYM